MRKLSELMKKKQELQDKISSYETEKKVTKQTVQKLTAAYNIGEIDFKEYQRRYKSIFKDKTPEQWINFYNMQIRSLSAQLDWCEQQIKQLGGKRKQAGKGFELKQGLSGRIAEAEQRKKAVLAEVDKLTAQWKSREISYGEYQHRIANDFGDKTPQEWVDYYDNYIKDCKSLMYETDRAIDRTRKKSFAWKAVPVLLGILFIGFFLWQYLPSASFTGFATQIIEQEFTQDVGQVFSEDGDYVLELEAQGQLNSLKISGEVAGDGEVRVYLDDLLVYEKESGTGAGITGGVITGFAAEGAEDLGSGDDGSDEGGDSGSDGGESEGNGGDDSDDSGESEATGSEDSEETGERDDDGSGQEGDSGSEGDAGDSGDGSDDGSEEPEEAEDVVEGNETDVDDGGSDGGDEEPEEVVIEFDEVCEETCDLSDLGLNESSYTLRIEVSGAELSLDEIVYDLEFEVVVDEDEPEENETEVEGPGFEGNVSFGNETEANVSEITGPPKLTSEIENFSVAMNGEFRLDVGAYFSNVDEIFVGQIEDILTKVQNKSVVFKPEVNFTGNRTSKIIVSNEFGSVESNEFGISVFEGFANESFENVSIVDEIENVTTLQYKAVIGKPTRWLKRVNVTEVNKSEGVKVKLPKESKNISVRTGGEIEEALRELEEYDDLIENSDRKELVSGLTGNVVSDLDDHKGILTKAWEWLTGFTITGNVVSEEELEADIEEAEDGKIVDLEKVVNETGADEVGVEYYTDGPQAFEEVTGFGKRVVVSGPDEIGYIDILSYAEIPENYAVGEEGAIKIYWVENQSYVNFSAGDLNENGMIDFVEWIVPHLSNQTFDIDLTGADSSTNVSTEGNFSYLSLSGSAPYDSLVFYQNFDRYNGTTTIDYSPSGLDGSLSGSGVIDADGFVGKTYLGDGSNGYVDAGQIDLSGLAGVTFSMWVKWREDAGANEDNILGNWQAPNAATLIRLDPGINRVEAYVAATGGTVGGGYSDLNVNDQNWHHIAILYNASGLYAYLDGTLSSTSFANDGNMHGTASTQQLTIGTTLHATQDNYNGSIDEVMIFNNALTQAQILDIYNNQTSRFEPSGEITFENFGDISNNSEISITLDDCATDQTSDLFAKINDGSYSEFSSCTIDSYSLIGITGLDDADVTILLNASNDQFYTPYISGNVTLVSSGDQRKPNVNFTGQTPANGSVQAGTNIEVNVTSSDDNGEHYVLTDFDNDLVLWMRMDDVNGSGDPIDLSSYSHNGSLVNNVVINNTGNYGNASWFDGTGDSITVDPLTELSGASEITVCSWVNLRTLGSGNGDDGGILTTTSSTNPLLLWYNYDGASGQTYTFNVGSTSTGANRIDGSTGAAKAGQWQHVCGVMDSGGRRLYIDGALNTSGSGGDSSFVPSTNATDIGRWSYTANFDLDGGIDEIAVWKRALNESEIAALYNASANEYYHNFTGLSYADHTFTSYAVDSAGNLNSTSRTVTIESSDTTSPVLNFTGNTPANDSAVGSDFVVNVSSSDDNGDHYVFTNFDDSLVAWITMDDDGTGETFDRSRYNRTVNNYGSGTIDIEEGGRFGSMSTFEGVDDYIRVDDDASGILELYNGGSISVWFKPREWSDILRFSDSQYQIRFTYGTKNDQIQFYSGGTYTYTDQFTITDDEWNHVVVVFNSSGRKIYINGVDETYSGGSETALPGGSSYGLLIGLGSSPMNGSIDDVIIFNRSLNDAEVGALYNATANQYFNEFQDLDGGEYDFTAYAVDTAGNINQTETWEVSVDAVAPQVNFTGQTPANGSTQSNFDIFVNLSSSDDNGEHYSFVDFDNDLIGWWRFDDLNSSGDLVDLSSYSRNATVAGDAFQTDSGRWGNGFEYDNSNDDVRVHDPVDLIGSEPRTWSIWAKRADPDGVGILLYRGAVATSGYYMSIQATDKVTFYDWQDFTLLTCDTPTVDDTNWHLYTAVYNTSDLQMYVDGTACSQLSSAVTLTSDTSNPIGIGYYYTGGTSMNGALDELMIFNRTLTADEIGALYNATADQYYNNFTNLEEGDHSFTGYAVDAFGNMNETERVVTLQGPDTTAPGVEFVDPTTVDGAFTNEMYVNLSTSDDRGMHYALTEFSNDVLLWMRMEEDTGLNDSSTWGNNGTAFGFTPSGSEAIYGEGFTFGSGDYIRVENLDSANLRGDSGPFTIAGWINTTSNGDIVSDMFVSKGTGFLGSDQLYGWEIYLGGSLFGDGRIYYNTYTGGISPVQNADNMLLATGEWVHFAIVDYGTTSDLYVNGSFVTDINSGAAVMHANSEFRIGLANESRDPFNGMIDEIVYINRSLNASEIASLYNASANKYDLIVTGLADGSYDYVGYAVDASGNLNQTAGSRSVTYDGNSPVVNYNPETPGDGSVVNSASFSVNVSSSDNNEHYVFTEFDDDLLLWLTMDDVNASGDPTDLSSWSNNGSISGDAVQNVSGRFGKSFLFDGTTDYIIVPDGSIQAKNADQRSWSFWYFHHSDGESGETFFTTVNPATSACGAGDGWQFYESASSNLRFEECDGLSGLSTTYVDEYNVWKHVVLTRDGTTTKIYVDGVENATGTVSFVDNSNDLIIGHGPGADGDAWNDFKGNIDDFLMFNRTLTAAEVAALYNASANQYVNEFSGLSDGESHTFRSWAVDAAGNVGSEEERSVTIDLSVPGIEFVDPTTDDGVRGQMNSDIYVNLSTSGGEHYSFVDLAGNVVLWMRMDNVNASGDPIDSSSWSNNGSIANGATQSGDGAFGEGFYFDGDNDYVMVPYSSEMNAGDAYTVSLWAKPAGSDPSGWVFSAYESVSDNLGIREVANQWRVWYDLNNAGNSAVTLGPIEDGWQHVVVIYNQSGIWGYKNGTLMDYSTTLTGSFNNMTDPDYFIGYNGGALNWNGTVDELIVFNRSLTLAEIQSLYNSSAYSYQNNFTGLGNGAYTYTGYAVDKGGNTNQTSARQVVIDTINPGIDFEDPTPENDSSASSAGFSVNLSTSESNEHYSFVDFDNDVLLWMRMDDVNGSGDPTDSSSHSNNGSKMNDAIQNVSGSHGKGFSFDGGSDYIGVPSDTSLDFYASGSYTWSAWVYGDWSTNLGGVIGKCSTGSPGSGYSIHIDGNNKLAIDDCTQIATVDYSDSTIPEYTWTHIAINYSNKAYTFFINGQTDGSGTISGFNDDTSSDLRIGDVFGTNPGQFDFKGIIDEVLIFNRSLDLGEIQALYNASANQYIGSFSGLSDGPHSFVGYGVDIAGNVNNTEERTVSVDGTNPGIEYVSPTTEDGIFKNEGSVYVNVSIDEANNHYAFTDLDSSLLLWMRMDDIVGGTSVTDLSSWSNNGTVNSGAMVSGGKFGQALDTDVGAVVINPATNIVPDNVDYTLATWIYPTSGTQEVIMMQEQGTADGFVLSYLADQTLRLLDRESGNDYDYWTTSSTLNVTLNAWNFVAVVYDASGNSATLYINNESESPVKATDSSIHIKGDRIFLGGGAVNGGDFGYMDEALVFNRTLSVSEVASLYNAGTNKHEENYTGLEDGPRSFVSHAVDIVGNRNSTETRSVTIDTTGPEVDFQGDTPADDGSVNVDNFVVNLTSSDLYSDHYAFLDFDNDVVLWMRMDDVDGSGDPVDLSSYSNNGTINNAVINSSSGYWGDGAWFDGTGDSITIGADSSLDFDDFGNYTWSMWVNLNSVGSDQRFITRSSIGNGYIILLEDDNTVSLGYSIPSGDGTANVLSTTKTLSADTWYHVAVTYNTENNISIFIDGELNVTGSGGMADLTGAGTTIGAVGPGGINGLMDEVLFFNRNLEASEVAALYNATANQYYNNFTDLADGDYDVTGYAVDSLGNRNQASRNISVNEPDAPVVTYIESFGPVTPMENSTKTVDFKITVEDLDGFDDIHHASANFSRNGEFREDADNCAVVGGEDSATSRNYTCSIDMQYFDEPGSWSIGVSASDQGATYAYNVSESFTYNILYSFISSPSEFSFAGDQGDVNATSDEDPITLTNYGNANITDIKLFGRNLYGESQTQYYIDVANISVGTSTGAGDPECGATGLVNGTNVSISGAELLRGNYSAGGGSGQEELYFCMKTVPTGLPSQDYSTSQDGSWVIYISLAALGLAGSGRRRKRKSKRYVLELFEDKLKNDNLSFEALAEVESELKRYNTSISELLKLAQRVKSDEEVPVDVFRGDVSPAEALCKYLKENKGMSYSEIALTLNRDDRTVWINYRNALMKKDTRMRISRTSITLPLAIFADRRLSVLEAAIRYLREKGMKNSEVSRLLNKDPRNTYTLYSRAMKKLDA
jgi:hypothetical protein